MDSQYNAARDKTPAATAMRRLPFLLLLLVSLMGCDKRSDGEPKSTAGGADPRRGKSIYLGNCAVCHNSDPGKDGSVGPAIAGASLELVTARVLKASYPPNYKPKRNSRAMPAQPYLKSAIPDLVAFLNQPQKSATP